MENIDNFDNTDNINYTVNVNDLSNFNITNNIVISESNDILNTNHNFLNYIPNINYTNYQETQQNLENEEQQQNLENTGDQEQVVGVQEQVVGEQEQVVVEQVEGDEEQGEGDEEQGEQVEGDEEQGEGDEEQGEQGEGDEEQDEGDEEQGEGDEEQGEQGEGDEEQDEGDEEQGEGDENLMEFNSAFNIFNNQEINTYIDNKLVEIMSWAYENMMTIDNSIIEFINLCYLKNLQYDDEPIDSIRYTIRTILNEGIQFNLKNVVANIFSYSITGMNMVFNENFDLLNGILNEELKRILRRSLTFTYFSQLLTNGFIIPNGLQSMDDIKLIIPDDELEKIPVKTFKHLDLELKTKNDKCPVCHDEYRENDNLRILPCEHCFHIDCIDNWLTQHSHKCPCCRKEAGNHKPKL
jgi:hypothetical protein